MEENIKIKNIYITENIINTTLLKGSIHKILDKYLSNSFYNNININYKIDLLIDKIDSIHKVTEDNNSIFNLAYQPFNEYSIKNDYINENYNKKWILPIINEQKSLYVNDVEVLENGDKLVKFFNEEENYRSEFNESKDKYTTIYDNDEKTINYEKQKINIDKSEEDIEWEDFSYIKSNKFIDLNEINKLEEQNKTKTLHDELSFKSLYEIEQTPTDIRANILSETKAIRLCEDNEICYYLNNYSIPQKYKDKKKVRWIYNKFQKSSKIQIKNIIEKDY